MKRFVFYMLIGLLCACNVDVKEIKYYDTGEISAKIFYKNKRDSIPYKVINYNKTGIVEDTLFYNSFGNLEGTQYSFNDEKNYQRWSEYINGIRNGANIIEREDGSKIIQHYKNDVIHGIEKHIDKKSNINNEVLWLNGKALALKEIHLLSVGDSLQNTTKTKDGLKQFFEVLDAPVKLCSYFKLLPEGRYCIGSLKFDTDGNIIDGVTNSYINFTHEDTIKKGEDLVFNIEGYYGNLEDVYLEVQIGELNQAFDFIEDPMIKGKSKIDSLNLNLVVKDYNRGYNLLLGKAQLKRGSNLISESIIFTDFYVK
jgi:antitoxin component YwqK of YwqJK toxin-antitoxin module